MYVRLVQKGTSEGRYERGPGFWTKILGFHLHIPPPVQDFLWVAYCIFCVSCTPFFSVITFEWIELQKWLNPLWKAQTFLGSQTHMHFCSRTTHFMHNRDRKWLTRANLYWNIFLKWDYFMNKWLIFLSVTCINELKCLKVPQLLPKKINQWQSPAKNRGFWSSWSCRKNECLLRFAAPAGAVLAGQCSWVSFGEGFNPLTNGLNRDNSVVRGSIPAVLPGVSRFSIAFTGGAIWGPRTNGCAVQWRWGRRQAWARATTASTTWGAPEPGRRPAWPRGKKSCLIQKEVPIHGTEKWGLVSVQQSLCFGGKFTA